jgi:hypothetical protein
MPISAARELSQSLFPRLEGWELQLVLEKALAVVRNYFRRGEAPA